MHISKLVLAGIMLATMIQYSQASEYVGERNSFNRFHGFGTYISGRGDRYEGNWVDGRKQGEGKQEWSSGEKYVGSWSDNKPHGKGDYTYANGENYKGEFVWGKRQGTGIMTYANGDVYEGEWFQDQRQGKGILKAKKGSTFEGEWKADQKSGNGVLTLANGDRLVGNWKKDEIAKGTYIAKNFQFEGPIHNNQPNGSGTCKVKGKTSPCEYANGKEVVKVVKKEPPPKPKPKPVPKPALKKEMSAAVAAVAAAKQSGEAAGELSPIAAERPAKQEPPKIPAPTKPEFYYEHNWMPDGKYIHPSGSYFEKDVRNLGDLRIRSENDKFILTFSISDYSGPGEYELGYFAGTTSMKGVATYATSSDESGKLIITHDENGKISGKFELTAYRNGNASGGDSKIIKNGRFTVEGKPE